MLSLIENDWVLLPVSVFVLIVSTMKVELVGGQ